MASDTASVQPGNTAVAGGKLRLLTLDDLDRRTRAAQRTLELSERLLKERGADRAGELRKAITRGVALLTTMIEDAGARWLSGQPIDPASIATLVNARRRDAELIGIDPEPRDVTPDPLERREDLARKLEERGLPPFVFGRDVPVLNLKAETEPVSGNCVGNGKGSKADMTP